jgi:hypothetical protein
MMETGLKLMMEEPPLKAPLVLATAPEVPM